MIYAHVSILHTLKITKVYREEAATSVSDVLGSSTEILEILNGIGICTPRQGEQAYTVCILGSNNSEIWRSQRNLQANSGNGTIDHKSRLQWHLLDMGVCPGIFHVWKNTYRTQMHMNVRFWLPYRHYSSWHRRPSRIWKYGVCLTFLGPPKSNGFLLN